MDSHRCLGIGFTLMLALAGCEQPAEPVEDCVDDATFFAKELWPKVIQAECMACHTAEGAARTSGMIFANAAQPDHLEADQITFTEIAGLERKGTSIVLLKPVGKEGHGGGAVLTEDSAAYALLRQFVERLGEDGSTCEAGGEEADPTEGIAPLPPTITLRKASLVLTGRLPDAGVVDAVRAGGERALKRAIEDLYAHPAFPERMKEAWNDVLLTDRYLADRDGLGLLDDERFTNTHWFDDAGEYGGDYNSLYDASSQAVAREPLELIAYVLRERKPWTEILTADYTMVNGFSAMSYSLADATWPDVQDPASAAWRPAQIPGYVHAGVLTMPAFVNRFPTTETNRNRHRAWIFMKTFLATDILAFADRPIDATVSEVHNPTMNDPQCTVCHATMDPVAGTFLDFDDEGFYRPPAEGWYTDMVPPGFGTQQMPPARRSDPLRWLAERSVADPRFGIATVRTWMRLLTGVEPLTEQSAGADEVRQAALRVQDAFVKRTAERFREADHDVRVVITAILMSPFFRGADDVGATPEVLWEAGNSRLLTPEALDRKITETTGYVWTSSAGREPYLLDRYKLLYGGIDSFGVVERLEEPNGVMNAIGLRMATEVACRAVPLDFTLPAEQRRLVPKVEADFAPQTDQGFEVPEARARIRENLRWLHSRLLGEELEEGSPELEESYQLFLDVWLDGRAAIAEGLLDDSLPSACRATKDPRSGADLPSERRLSQDPDHLVRAWVAVVAYLLSDYHFLHE